MYLGILQDLGLTLNEAKIYQTLIEEGGLSAGMLSIKGKIHRRNVYDTLDRLIEKRLVFQILDKGENIYQAVEPAKLLELVKEKEDKLKKILPALQKQFITKPAPQEVYIYRGLEGFKNYLRDVLRVKQGVYSMGAKGIWFDPRLKTFFKNFLTQARGLGINYHHIFDAQVKNQLPQIVKIFNPPYKFLPAKYATQATYDVFGDHVVTFSGLGIGEIIEDVVIYVLVDQTLADSYRQWFNFIWDQLPAAENPNQIKDNNLSPPTEIV